MQFERRTFQWPYDAVWDTTVNENRVPSTHKFNNYSLNCLFFFQVSILHHENISFEFPIIRFLESFWWKKKSGQTKLWIKLSIIQLLVNFSWRYFLNQTLESHKGAAIFERKASYINIHITLYLWRRLTTSWKPKARRRNRDEKRDEM